MAQVNLAVQSEAERFKALAEELNRNCNYSPASGSGGSAASTLRWRGIQPGQK